tara:strand:+ start:544 stop:1011 length:468 start_codon:yes stop_codon:yes gene_type:complete
MRFVALLLLMVCELALAAPPPFGTWLKLRITSCQPVTFSSPDDPSAAVAQLFLPGEEVRVTLLIGEVLEAKNFNRTGLWDFNFPPPASSLTGTQFVAFVNERQSHTCADTLPADIEFIRVWGCDLGWRRGTCSPPFPQVERVRPDQRFNFVAVPK